MRENACFGCKKTRASIRAEKDIDDLSQMLIYQSWTLIGKNPERINGSFLPEKGVEKLEKLSEPILLGVAGFIGGNSPSRARTDIAAGLCAAGMPASCAKCLARAHIAHCDLEYDGPD